MYNQNPPNQFHYNTNFMNERVSISFIQAITKTISNPIREMIKFHRRGIISIGFNQVCFTYNRIVSACHPRANGNLESPARIKLANGVAYVGITLPNVLYKGVVTIGGCARFVIAIWWSNVPPGLHKYLSGNPFMNPLAFSTA